MANCYGQEDIETALQAGASGVGLLRSGYLMLPGRPVDEQEQFVFYQSCIAAAKGGVVTVRTFDFGADRTVADAHQGPESSKLGLRGIRSSLRRPHQFETQICALLRAAAHGPLRIMFPMVTNLEDWDEAMMLVERCRQHLREAGGGVQREHALRRDAGSAVGLPDSGGVRSPRVQLLRHCHQ